MSASERTLRTCRGRSACEERLKKRSRGSRREGATPRAGARRRRLRAALEGWRMHACVRP
eukprot:scaffold15058_cov73-Phaeocystis_antarctica.AAC.1